MSGSGDKTVRLWSTESFAVRYRNRLERRRLIEELAARVLSLLAKLESATAVAARIREDPALSGRRLEVALQIVLAESVERAR